MNLAQCPGCGREVLADYIAAIAAGKCRPCSDYYGMHPNEAAPVQPRPLPAWQQRLLDGVDDDD